MAFKASWELEEKAEPILLEASASREGEPGNILSQYTEDQVMQMGRNYALKHDLDPELFARAAALARSPADFNCMSFLLESEKVLLNREITHKWHIPRKLVEVIALGSMAAAVQGMDASIKLVFVRASGPVFCAGADLKEREGMGAAQVRERRMKAFAAYAALEALPIPAIAVVEGPAVGSGCEIAAACDFIVAAERIERLETYSVSEGGSSSLGLTRMAMAWRYCLRLRGPSHSCLLW